MDIKNALGSSIPEELRESVEKTFSELQKNYLRRDWKSVGIDAGHFVEATRRIVDHILFGKYKPIGKSLDSFNESALAKYRDAPADESLRILIPRQLWALYSLRNKRSIGHLGVGPALQIDANILLYGSKWIVAELVRLTSGLPVHAAMILVDSIVEHHVSPIWREGEITRILNPKMVARDQVLILLSFVGEMGEEKIRSIVEYKNFSNFRKILRRLHEAKLIEYSGALCKVSPTGFKEAQYLVDKYTI